MRGHKIEQAAALATEGTPHHIKAVMDGMKIPRTTARGYLQRAEEQGLLEPGWRQRGTPGTPR